MKLYLLGMCVNIFLKLKGDLSLYISFLPNLGAAISKYSGPEIWPT